MTKLPWTLIGDTIAQDQHRTQTRLEAAERRKTARLLDEFNLADRKKLDDRRHERASRRPFRKYGR
jgi:hypothetical protein